MGVLAFFLSRVFGYQLPALVNKFTTGLGIQYGVIDFVVLFQKELCYAALFGPWRSWNCNAVGFE